MNYTHFKKFDSIAERNRILTQNLKEIPQVKTVKEGYTKIVLVKNIKEIIETSTANKAMAPSAATAVTISELTAEKKEQKVKTPDADVPEVEPQDTDAVNKASVKENSDESYTVDRSSELIDIFLEEAGIDADQEVKDKLFVEVIKAYLNGDITISTNISDVTRLISIVLNSAYGGVNTTDVTELIDKVLNSDGREKHTSISELRDFILNKAYEIISVPDIPEPEIPIPNAIADEIFGSTDTLSAWQIYDNRFKSYNDDSKDIMSAIKNATSNLGISYDSEEFQRFANIIIKKINETCGIETDSQVPKLAKSTLNQYFTNHTMEELTDFIGSNEAINAYYQAALKAAGMDDILGDFKQNKKEGDCYFLATLYSIANTPKGAELLAEAFGTVEIDGITHYTFTFKGGYRNKNGDESANNYCTKTTTYTFSPQEILDAWNNGFGASGDINATVAELALEALMKDQVYTSEPNTSYRNGYLANGTGVQVVFLLTGINNTQYTSSGQEFKNFVMNLLNSGAIEEGTTGNYMMYFGFNGHARAIVGVTKDGIYYVDPYNTSEKLFLSWETILNNPSIYKNFQWANLDSSGSSYWNDWY